MLFEKISVGDYVLINGTTMSKVTKVTSSRFEVRGMTFLRDNGSQWGGGTYSSYHTAKPATEENIAAAKLAQDTKVLRAKLTEKISNLSFAELSEISSMLSPQ